MFKSLRKTAIPELKASLEELQHEPSKARIIHIANDDSENLFAVGFRTYPEKSHGVAHILEHTVLCGSEKFPIKDPFFAMTRRSMATYMNALTGSDFTLYPAASEIKKDFYNLLNVYLDALFHPLLKKTSFLQEGSRLEFETIDDPKSPLVYRGIVYNEMKGAMASLDARLWKKSMELLFPTLTYGYNSGGDPEAIPSLSYEELLAFYKTYYHPSQALFFFYGNIPLQEHLDFLEKNLLSSVVPAEELKPLQPEKRFKEPKTAFCPYPLTEAPEERYAQILAWLTCSITDPLTWLSLQLLEVLLMGHDGAPFKKAMLESGLCHSVESVVDPDIAEMPFLFIFKGLKEGSLVSEKAVEVLRDITSFSSDDIEAALHQIELSRSEITGGSHPFGLNLALRSILLKLHGTDPLKGLTFHELIKTLREKCAEPGYLRGLIEQFLLNNPHRITLTMVPDPSLQKAEIESEAARLEAIKERLSDADKQALIEQAEELEERQKHEFDQVDCLPKITLSDVSLTPKIYPLAQTGALFSHSTFTNGLVYATVTSPLPSMSPSELVDSKLVLSLLGELGTKKKDFVTLLNEQQRYSGGFQAGLSFEPLANNYLDFQAKIFFKMKGLKTNLAQMTGLLKEIIFETELDDAERLKQMLRKQIIGIETNLIRNAMRYAVGASTAGFSQVLAISHFLSGPSYLDELKKREAEEPAHLIKRLKEALERLIGLQDTALVVSAEEPLLDVTPFLGTKPYSPYKGNLPLKSEESRFTIASQVAFNAFSLPLSSYTQKESPLFSLAAQLMEHRVLHPLIREQGGAYGARANHSPLTGHFTFSSYRDPHIAETRAAFRKASEDIAGGHFDADHLEEAKFSLLQDMDAPLAPGQRAEVAYSWFLSGRTTELRAAWRKRLLEATPELVAEATLTHILARFDEGIFATYTGKDIV